MSDKCQKARKAVTCMRCWMITSPYLLIPSLFVCFVVFFRESLCIYIGGLQLVSTLFIKSDYYISILCI